MVTILSVLPYLPALNFGFVYDDDLGWPAIGRAISQPQKAHCGGLLK